MSAANRHTASEWVKQRQAVNLDAVALVMTAMKMKRYQGGGRESEWIWLVGSPHTGARDLGAIVTIE
jgi:hypothetical protein